MAKKKDVKPNSTEFQSLKDWLKAQGFKTADLDTALGISVSNRTREQIATDLVVQLKTNKNKKS